MFKLFLVALLFLINLAVPSQIFAKSDSFVSVVNPVRGSDFWDQKDQEPSTAVSGQIAILKKFNLKATWLVRFDALFDQKIINLLDQGSDEIGLFFEITPSLTKEASVAYHDKGNWHDAASAFLSGYERLEREKLINTTFEKFKQIFGFYPKSVGAWWIDSYSLSYMQEKYGITASLIVSDQYTTDNYQIWGQYFGMPYYPAKNNVLHPASTEENKLPVVMTQWAARDPLNGYGDGVMQSTFSVQANDYIDYHKLDTKYFSSLVDIYTRLQFNQLGFLVVGLENSYSWNKYAGEYENQIKILSEKNKNGQFQVVTLKDFSLWYQDRFPGISPEHLLVAEDPLGSGKKAVWFMNPYYRAGWFYNQDGSVFRDIRQYIDGEEELCFLKRCFEVNFASFATRVLDDVTYGNKLVIDEGRIKDFKASKNGENYQIEYINEAGNERKIEFLPKDIGIDGKISSIDTTILNATKQDLSNKKQTQIEKGFFKWSFDSVSKTVEFILFLIFGCIIPGLLLIRKTFEEKPVLLKIFLAIVIGFVVLTLVFYILSLLKLRLLIFLYLLVNLILFIRLKLYSFKIQIPRDLLSVLSFITVAAGTVFLSVPSFRNGLIYPYGLGLWGPNTHDGIWHLSLINQLIKSVPPENPIFAGVTLKNYHFFYDLLIAAASFISTIAPVDLVFRFYPVIFALLLGIGTYYLSINLFKNRLAAIFSLYFVYFSGSFGWIVAYVKDKNFAGESAFWANQAISFNLNPPFAVSLLIVIAFLHILFNLRNTKSSIFLTIILAGSLIGFKAYGAVLILCSLLIFAAIRKKLLYFLIFIGSSILSTLISIPNFKATTGLFILSPFWLINTMIDSPDRVGWTRLSIARQVGLETRNWFKFISAEVLSLLLFIVGNLGLRVLSLVSLIKTKAIFKDDKYLFLLIFSLLSILIPILFIQSGNPWNTIQFSYYGLFVTALVSGAILRFFPKILIILILVLTPINSAVTASYYTGYVPHAKIDQKELTALEFLSKQEDGVVLTYPYDKKIKQKIAEPWSLFAYDSTAYVSAFSKKSVYLEDEPQNEILLTDYKKRLVASKDFFYSYASGKDFLKTNNIKYIYLHNTYNVSLDTDRLGIEQIFSNDEVIIFKVI